MPLIVCAHGCFQYQPGVLEACLQILQVSPQHLSDAHKDYILRGDPVYISRVVCAMVRNQNRGYFVCLHSIFRKIVLCNTALCLFEKD